MRIRLGCLLWIVISLLSCQTKEKNYFAGEIHTVPLPSRIDTLYGREIVFDSVYTGHMVVYDSLLFFTSSKFPEYNVYMANARTGKHLACLLRKGQGYKEFLYLSMSERFIVDEKGAPHFRGYAFNNQKLIDINLQELIASLNTTHSINDSAITTSEFLWSMHHTVPYRYVFPLKSNRILAGNALEKLFTNQSELNLPAYELLDASNGEIIKKYPLFTQQITNPSLPEDIPYFYLSTDVLHPDESKIAIAMTLIGQLNIINLQTGKMECFKIEGTKDMSYLEKSIPQNFHAYYQNVTADEQHIYALYVNKPFFANEKLNNTNMHSHEIHVFDWNGNFLKRLYLDQEVQQIRLNAANGLLYAKENIGDRIFVYELKGAEI